MSIIAAPSSAAAWTASLEVDLGGVELGHVDGDGREHHDHEDCRGEQQQRRAPAPPRDLSPGTARPMVGSDSVPAR